MIKEHLESLIKYDLCLHIAAPIKILRTINFLSCFFLIDMYEYRMNFSGNLILSSNSQELLNERQM